MDNMIATPSKPITKSWYDILSDALGEWVQQDEGQAMTEKLTKIKLVQMAKDNEQAKVERRLERFADEEERRADEIETDVQKAMQKILSDCLQEHQRAHLSEKAFEKLQTWQDVDWLIGEIKARMYETKKLADDAEVIAKRSKQRAKRAKQRCLSCCIEEFQKLNLPIEILEELQAWKEEEQFVYEAEERVEEAKRLADEEEARMKEARQSVLNYCLKKRRCTLVT